MKQHATYVMTNKRNGTLDTGVTSNLSGRDWQHKQGAITGFTKDYHCHLLVWYACHDTMEQAILHEKQIKAGSRQKKLALIEAMNPNWENLSTTIHS